MKKIILAFALPLALLACSSEPQAPLPAPLDYSQWGRIELDVRNINLINRAGDELQSSHDLSAMFHPTIADAIKRWASDRLVAVGNNGQATIVIKEASVTSQPLPMQQGMDSWFKRQQATKYTAHAVVDINARTGNAETGAESAYATAEATHSVTVLENPTDAERNNAYRTMLDGLMQELGQNLDISIHQHMQTFVVAVPTLNGSSGVEMPVVPMPNSGVIPQNYQPPRPAQAPEPLPPQPMPY